MTATNPIPILPDWRKAASAAAAGTVADDMAVEKAFMDQAYAAVQNKCGPLMRSPHQIGFEIVHKNDAATRMVGLFGFRAGRQLFYVPAFFLSGEIKGTDLLYRHLTKTFVPNTEEWVVYLIEGAKSESGRGIARSDVAKLPVRMDLQTLAYPPMTGASYFHKGAAAGVLRGLARQAPQVLDKVKKIRAADVVAGGSLAGLVGEQARKDLAKKTPPPPAKIPSPAGTKVDPSADPLKKEALHAAWEEFFDQMEAKEVERFNIKEAMLAIGPDAVEKLACLMEQSLPFATELHRCIPSEDWMPEEMISMAKEAASAPRGREVPVLSISHFGTSPEFAKFGFEIKDDRSPQEVNTVYENDESLQRTDEPGKWSLLMVDGEMKDAFVFHVDEDDCPVGRRLGGNDEHLDSPAYPRRSTYKDPSHKRVVVIMADGKQSCEVMVENALGVHEDLVDQVLKSPLALTELTKHKAYRAVDPATGIASHPFVVLSRTDRDGVTEYRITSNGYGEERLITINPDAPRNDFKAGSFNSSARFFEVALKKFEERRGDSPWEDCDPCRCPEYDLEYDLYVPLGDSNTVNVWLRTYAPVKKASVVEDSYTGDIEIRCGSQIARVRSKMAAAGVLAAGMHIDRDTVYQILGDLKPGSLRKEFTLWEKKAAQLRLVDEPDFQTYTDNDFGLTVDPTQQFILQTEWDGPQPPDPRIGDAWDPTMGHRMENEGIGLDNLLSMEPDQIAQLASDGKTPSVFEHGVIGSLVHTFDANALVQSYLPKLEDAVDALGRTVFLFFWKPADFEMSYGADDMSQLENQLISNFKSLGSILLELLKRSKQQNQGNNTSGRG